MSTDRNKEQRMQKDTAYQAVCDAFGHYFEVHPRQVLAHHDLRHDWGLEPVELELLVAHIEESVGVELTEAIPLSEVTTISQLVRAVRTQLRRAAHPAPLRHVG
jgi:hypothetical protein